VLELMRQLVALRGLDSSDCDRDEELLGPERLDATTQLRVSSTKWDDYYIKAKAEGLSPPWESTVPFAELKEWIDWSLLSNTQKISAIPAAPLTLASADGADAGISAAFALDTSATVTVPAVLKAGGDIGETAKFGSVAAPLPPSKFIELGCGSSASACWLVALGYDVTAVDISLPGLIRAQSQRNEGADRVSWLLADLLSPRLFQEAHPVIGEEGKAQFESKQVEVTVGSIPSVEDSRASGSIHTFGVQAETVALKNCHRAPLIEASYDALFDLQCFHALRDVDEKRICSVISKLVKPGGVAMIVTGAPEGKSEGSVEVEVEATQPGPPRLSAEEVVDPFKAEGLELVNIWKSRFNPTAAYSAAGKLPPACWVAVFRKPSIAV
jgi:SAM-dependent methyltransferase